MTDEIKHHKALQRLQS